MLRISLCIPLKPVNREILLVLRCHSKPKSVSLICPLKGTVASGISPRRGKKKQIKKLAPGVLRYHGHRIRVKRSRGWRWMRIASVVGVLGKTGEVRLVCSKRSGPSSKELLSVVTNETNMKPRDIIVTYEKRWNIEVLFKELRNSLGLGEYQVLSRTAIERHMHLSCLAHQTPTHQAIMEEGAKAKQINKDVILPTLNQQIQKFRQRVNRDRTNRLLNRKGQEVENETTFVSP